MNESGDLGSGQRPSHVDPHLRCAGRSQILCHEGEDPGIHIPFQAKVDQDKANLAKAQADVLRVKAGLVQAEKELGRSRELQKKELISASDLDAAIATYDSFAAQVKVAEAAVAQAQAALESSMVNLRYTTIKSPIDGIVISRNVVFQLQFELVGGDIRCQRCEIHARRLHRPMEAQDAGDACRKLSRRLKLKSLEAGRKAPGRILALELNGESLGQQSQRELSGESELGGGPFRGRLSDN